MSNIYGLQNQTSFQWPRMGEAHQGQGSKDFGHEQGLPEPTLGVGQFKVSKDHGGGY